MPLMQDKYFALTADQWTKVTAALRANPDVKTAKALADLIAAALDWSICPNHTARFIVRERGNEHQQLLVDLLA